MKYDSRGYIESAYELLCTYMPDEERLDAMKHMRGLGYRTKTIKSGKMLEIMCYPILKGQQAAAKRAKKEKASSVRKRQYNEEKRVMRFIRLAETNFTDKDYFFTGTFEGDDLPDEAEVKRAFKNFKARINYRRKQFGLKGNARMIGTFEGKEDGDNKKRLHIHMLVDGDLPRDVIESEWPYGYANTKRIQKSGDGSLIGLVKYMTKQVRRHYEHAYFETKNLKKPIETVADRKVSCHKAWKIASRPEEAKEILENKIYKGYKIEDNIKVKTSEFLPGAFIYIKMRLVS